MKYKNALHKTITMARYGVTRLFGGFLEKKISAGY